MNPITTLARGAFLLAERGLAPDPLVRAGIRRLCKTRLAAEGAEFGPDDAAYEAHMRRWLERLRTSEIAPLPKAANAQHYEVPARFFELVLGPRMKYSSCLFEPETMTLGRAEEAMLALTAERARLAAGQRILELGCGWGSLTLWMAENLPGTRITAVSNSASQKAHIEARARERGLSGITVLTRDMNTLRPADLRGSAGYDRIVSVEMFEHMRNWEGLLARLHEVLAPDGFFFAHVFAHKRFAYAFDPDATSPGAWMSRTFFSGGQMPVSDQFARLDTPFQRVEHWELSGMHYARTAEAWLANLDAHRARALAVLEEQHGPDAGRWLQRWRMFFLACAELFAFAGGTEWIVAHELMQPRTLRAEARRPLLSPAEQGA